MINRFSVTVYYHVSHFTRFIIFKLKRSLIWTRENIHCIQINLNQIMSTSNKLDHDAIKKQITETIKKLKNNRDATFAHIGPLEVLFMKTGEKKISCCSKNTTKYWELNERDEYEKIFDSIGIMFSGATRGSMLSHAFNMI